jgi:hypothetical protein
MTYKKIISIDFENQRIIAGTDFKYGIPFSHFKALQLDLQENKEEIEKNYYVGIRTPLSRAYLDYKFIIFHKDICPRVIANRKNWHKYKKKKASK